MQEYISRYLTSLNTRSLSALRWLEGNIAKLAIGWSIILTLFCVLRIAIAPDAPLEQAGDLLFLLLYALIIISPLAAVFVTFQAFAPGKLLAQPKIRLSRIGQWKNVDCITARRHPSFGANGLMTGLVIGLLINIVVRSGEFLLSMPAVNTASPLWAQQMFVRFALDVISVNMLYGICFAMAIRHVPWFPRFLLLAWIVDLLSQMNIAYALSSMALPVAVIEPLVGLLTGNMQKVLIGIGLWMPYMILSERVNLTYRMRIPR